MDNTPPPQLEKGTFLIATPDIENGMFFRGVILLCEHNASGSFGLLINKPLDLELPEEILNLNEVSNPHVSIRAGGPVQTNQMMILHTDEESSSHTLNICDGVFLGGDLQFLQEMIQSETGPHIHLCFGYAGWTAGQLEREFLDGSWYIYKATSQLVFNTPPGDMWRAILRQMGGKYGTLSMLPDDLSVN